MDNILHFNMKQNSFVSALPYLAMWLFSIMCSTIADYLISHQIFKVTTVRKIFNSIGIYILSHMTYIFINISLLLIGQYGPALALIGAGFIGCSKLAAVFLLTLAVGLSGASYSGFQVNFVEIAPPYAGTLFGVTNALANMCGFLAPAFVGVLVQGNVWIGTQIRNYNHFLSLFFFYHFLANSRSMARCVYHRSGSLHHLEHCLCDFRI